MTDTLSNFQSYGWVQPLTRPMRGRWMGGVSRPQNTQLPVISGELVNDSVLTTTTGVWHPPGQSYVYQWYRAGILIVGAVAMNYTTVNADVGELISVSVVAINSQGQSLPVFALAVGPIGGAILLESGNAIGLEGGGYLLLEI